MNLPINEVESLMIGDETFQIWVLPVRDLLEMGLGVQVISIAYNNEGTTTSVHAERAQEIGFSSALLKRAVEQTESQNCFEALRVLSEQSSLSAKEEKAYSLAVDIQLDSPTHDSPSDREFLARAIAQATLLHHSLLGEGS